MKAHTGGQRLRKVAGRSGIHEVVDAYRPVRNAPGPFVIVDESKHGGRESPRMTEPMPYSSGTEPHAKSSRAKTTTRVKKTPHAKTRARSDGAAY